MIALSWSSPRHGSCSICPLAPRALAQDGCPEAAYLEPGSPLSPRSSGLPPGSAEACRPCAGCLSPPSPAPPCSCWSPWGCSTTPGLSWSSPVWQVVVDDNERWWQLFNDYHQNQSQILNQKKMYNHRNLLICLLHTLLLAVFVFLISRTDRIKVFRPHFDRALDVFVVLLLLWRHDLKKQSLRCLLRNLELEGSTIMFLIILQTHEGNSWYHYVNPVSLIVGKTSSRVWYFSSWLC